MSGYIAPVEEMRFALEEAAELRQLAEMPGGENADPELVTQVLEEAGKLASEVLAPLNAPGDRMGSVLENGVVRTPAGFRDAYWKYVEGGWNAIPFDPAYGGQGMPWPVATAVQEMWQSANMSWALMPLLTQGAVELLEMHGSDEQRRLYLGKLISGEWDGTMNLTEPAAGSDVGAVRTRAMRGDGHYRIIGQKIFITYGEQDWTENIIHLVLARTPDAPPGAKGISLFIVPKFQVEADGRLGQRNDLRCVSIEHKLGIHASPTCVMAYGDAGGATGYLVGGENRGLEYMFTMMNLARLSVGVQGVAIAERAYQQARDYARERVQSRELGGAGGEPVAIIRHPDVRRMLLAMRAQTEAARALAYAATASLDLAKRHPDEGERRRHQARVDLLTPVVKAWATDTGVETASLGIQVHGGMGFIEETGAAQHYRDARITPIYEGTNGIQANDLVFRKLGRDDGAAAAEFFAEIEAFLSQLAAAPGDEPAALKAPLAAGLDALKAATRWLVQTLAADPRRAAAGAAPYLRLFGVVAGGYLMARSALAAARRLGAGRSDSGFLRAKLVSARFFADHVLALAPALAHTVVAGGEPVLSFEEARF